MRLLVVFIFLLVAVTAFDAYLLTTKDHRITQLEMALAQAQALLAEESLTTGDLGLDSPAAP